MVKWFARDRTEGLTDAQVEFVQDDYAARVRRAPGTAPDLE